jgi:hypothetical protein
VVNTIVFVNHALFPSAEFVCDACGCNHYNSKYSATIIKEGRERSKAL